MFIQEKYLITSNSTGAAPVASDSTATILICKHCKREFMVPNEEVSKLDAVDDVCESTECVKAHDKESMTAKMAEIKTETSKIVNNINGSVTDEINKALGR